MWGIDICVHSSVYVTTTITFTFISSLLIPMVSHRITLWYRTIWFPMVSPPQLYAITTLLHNNTPNTLQHTTLSPHTTLSHWTTLHYYPTLQYHTGPHYTITPQHTTLLPHTLHYHTAAHYTTLSHYTITLDHTTLHYTTTHHTTL